MIVHIGPDGERSVHIGRPARTEVRRLLRLARRAPARPPQDAPDHGATAGTAGAPCRWCGVVDCPDAFDHDRLYRAREASWREQ
jgi:hypothetical protein